jgi:hypothetical protein
VRVSAVTNSMAADPWMLFNRKLSDFTSDLVTSFPHVPEFNIMRKSAQLMANVMDVKGNQALFDKHVASRYADHIKCRDEAFFLTESYAAAGGNTSSGLNVVEVLKGVWRSLSDADKDAMWRHLQVLVILNERCKVAAAASASRAPPSQGH